jgi:nicotinamide riboside kinase
MPEPQRICLIGAECTGKSTMAQALAAHFGGLWVPEYLRTFCEVQGRTPRVDEQAAIMRTQFDQEEQVAAQALATGCGHVFCDSAPLLTATYSEFYFSDTSLFVAAHALHGGYALTLLLQPDVPWVADAIQRDGAPVRTRVQALLQHTLQASRYPHIEVSGVGESRLQAAILAVETLNG